MMSVRPDVVWDGRWRGRHGIGRHADEISRRLPSGIKQLAGSNPASPLDPLRLTALLARLSPRIFVSPGYNAAFKSNCRQLVTVHDLIHLTDVSESSRLKRAYYSAVVAPTIRQTGFVLTVSHYTACAISKWANIPVDRVKVVGNGTSIARASKADLEDAARYRDEFGHYVLYVGNSRPHKNLGLLLDALNFIDPAIRLTLVGPSRQVVERLVGHGISDDRVQFLQGVNDQELRRLYLNASCLVLPSTEEGFGLPALEAMALGIPTAYCCDAVQEVVGDLGFRSPSDDPRSFALAVDACLGATPADRQALVTRSMLFEWDSTANQVMEAIEDASSA
jgi:glycosyltransferase involved in cell wall biosynthesis